MKPNEKHSGGSRSRRSRSQPGAASADRAASGMSPYADSLLHACASIPRLQMFNAAIRSAGLAALFDGAGPITIFAPTDRAFQRMPSERRSAVLSDPTQLAELLRHHVVAGRVSAPGEAKPRTVRPEFGDDLELTRSARGFHVDQARIVRTNIRASNGVIHAIDRVLDSRAS
jgi:uncharacterized surface protein with fasciclin (FAS1) repeats